jgi:hypothetical protein
MIDLRKGIASLGGMALRTLDARQVRKTLCAVRLRHVKSSARARNRVGFMSWLDLARDVLLALFALAAVGAIGVFALAWLLNHPKD